MSNNSIKTTNNFWPQIYAYSTPEIDRHEGWVKIGFTGNDVDERIKQQTHTADVKAKKEWQGNAIFDDKCHEWFRDTDFHDYLRKHG